MQMDNVVAPRRRRFGRLAVGLAACGLLASCANLVGPRQVELPLHKLQASLDRRFPLDNRMLELFDVRLSRPQLSIQPESDRVALAVDAAFTPPFIGQALSGQLAFSGRLYVDPQRSAVMMAEPRVDRFSIGDMNASSQRQLAKVANVVMEKAMLDVPIYSFKSEDLRYAGVQFVPTRIETRNSALLVTLEPVK